MLVVRMNRRDSFAVVRERGLYHSLLKRNELPWPHDRLVAKASGGPSTESPAHSLGVLIEAALGEVAHAAHAGDTRGVLHDGRRQQQAAHAGADGRQRAVPHDVQVVATAVRGQAVVHARRVAGAAEHLDVDLRLVAARRLQEVDLDGADAVATDEQPPLAAARGEARADHLGQLGARPLHGVPRVVAAMHDVAAVARVFEVPRLGAADAEHRERRVDGARVAGARGGERRERLRRVRGRVVAEDLGRRDAVPVEAADHPDVVVDVNHRVAAAHRDHRRLHVRVRHARPRELLHLGRELDVPHVAEDGGLVRAAVDVQARAGDGARVPLARAGLHVRAGALLERLDVEADAVVVAGELHHEQVLAQDGLLLRLRRRRERRGHAAEDDERVVVGAVAVVERGAVVGGAQHDGRAVLAGDVHGLPAQRHRRLQRLADRREPVLRRGVVGEAQVEVLVARGDDLELRGLLRRVNGDDGVAAAHLAVLLLRVDHVDAVDDDEAGVPLPQPLRALLDGGAQEHAELRWAGSVGRGDAARAASRVRALALGAGGADPLSAVHGTADGVAAEDALGLRDDAVLVLKHGGLDGLQPALVHRGVRGAQQPRVARLRPHADVLALVLGAQPVDVAHALVGQGRVGLVRQHRTTQAEPAAVPLPEPVAVLLEPALQRVDLGGDGGGVLVVAHRYLKTRESFQ
mmetsp:Transcript_30917/g.95474  ORF Transcript_30917/g.95474 Transcript_30917/m.95474 type:complete len:691 (+) Transcript_30917:264-2336(+)